MLVQRTKPLKPLLAQDSIPLPEAQGCEPRNAWVR